MLSILILWLILAFLSFGVLGLNYVYARGVAKKPWKIKDARAAKRLQNRYLNGSEVSDV
jgi:hypothetical protein